MLCVLGGWRTLLRVISSKRLKSLLTSVIILESPGSSTFVGTLAPTCGLNIAPIPLKAKST